MVTMLYSFSLNMIFKANFTLYIFIYLLHINLQKKLSVKNLLANTCVCQKRRFLRQHCYKKNTIIQLQSVSYKCNYKPFISDLLTFSFYKSLAIKQESEATSHSLKKTCKMTNSSLYNTFYSLSKLIKQQNCDFLRPAAVVHKDRVKESKLVSWVVSQKNGHN